MDVMQEKGIILRIHQRQALIEPMDRDAQWSFPSVYIHSPHYACGTIVHLALVVILFANALVSYEQFLWAEGPGGTVVDARLRGERHRVLPLRFRVQPLDCAIDFVYAAGTIPFWDQNLQRLLRLFPMPFTSRQLPT